MLMKAFQEVRFKQGQQIIREGEPGDKFYLLDSGTCDIAVQGKGTVMKAKRGVAFGELALLHNAPRAATVTAESDVGAWQVDATTFKSILMSKSKTDAQDYASFIKEVPLLRSLSKEAVRSLLDALEEQAFGAEQQIVKEGDTGDAFYIVREGEVKCTAKKSKVEVSRRLKRSDFFGEHSLEPTEPTAPAPPPVPHPPHLPHPPHSPRCLRAPSAHPSHPLHPPHRLCTVTAPTSLCRRALAPLLRQARRHRQRRRAHQSAQARARRLRAHPRAARHVQGDEGRHRCAGPRQLTRAPLRRAVS